MPELKPPTDLSFNLGTPGARWKNAYVQNISDGKTTFPLADVAARFAYLDSKGVVTPHLTLYVRTNGSDANDGSTATKPLASVQGAINRMVKFHRGLLSVVYIDIGAGTFNGDFALPGFNDIWLNWLIIQGESMDTTILKTTNRYLFNYCTIVTVRRLTLKRSGSEETAMCAAQSAVRRMEIQDVHFDNSDMTGKTKGITATDCGGIFINLLGTVKFTGTYGDLFLAVPATGSRFLFNTTLQLEVTANTFYDCMINCYSAVDVVVNTTLMPIFGDRSAGRYFAYLGLNSHIVFYSASLAAAYKNGMNSALDGTSSIINR